MPLRPDIRALAAAAIIIIAPALSSQARADIVYSTFAPGYTYTNYSNDWSIVDSYGPYHPGFAFTVPGQSSYTLDAIVVSIEAFYPYGDYGKAVLSLFTDVNGSAGNLLGIWDVPPVPDYPSSWQSYVSVTVPAPDGPVLQAGDTYILQASPLTVHDSLVWSTNANLVATVYENGSPNQGNVPPGVFEIDGTPVGASSAEPVPEPASIALLCASMLALTAVSRHTPRR